MPPGDRARRGELEAVVQHARPVHLEQFDVDDDLGAGLVDGGDQAAGRLRCARACRWIDIALVAVIGDRRRMSTTIRSRSIVSLRSALLR